MRVVDKNTIQIEIWERGVGYTLASGTSSTAAAATVFALGLYDSNISVLMPGGSIEITLDNDLMATMTGPVCFITEGRIANQAFKTFGI